jgi:hypothetical protein
LLDPSSKDDWFMEELGALTAGSILTAVAAVISWLVLKGFFYVLSRSAGMSREPQDSPRGGTVPVPRSSKLAEPGVI